MASAASGFYASGFDASGFDASSFDSHIKRPINPMKEKTMPIGAAIERCCSAPSPSVPKPSAGETAMCPGSKSTDLTIEGYPNWGVPWGLKRWLPGVPACTRPWEGSPKRMLPGGSAAAEKAAGEVRALARAGRAKALLRGLFELAPRSAPQPNAKGA